MEVLTKRMIYSDEQRINPYLPLKPVLTYGITMIRISSSSKYWIESAILHLKDMRILQKYTVKCFLRIKPRNTVSGSVKIRNGKYYLIIKL